MIAIFHIIFSIAVTSVLINLTRRVEKLEAKNERQTSRLS